MYSTEQEKNKDILEEIVYLFESSLPNLCLGNADVLPCLSLSYSLRTIITRAALR